MADAAADLAALTPKSAVDRAGGGADTDEVSVLVDGKPVSLDVIGRALPVNPGPHKIEGTRGDMHAVVNLTLVEGERKPALLRFGSSPQTPPPAEVDGGRQLQAPPPKLGTQRTLALVAGGVGVLGVASARSSA